MILSEFLQPLANHVWQSTLFAVVAGLLTLTLRKNRAQTRYWLWLAASVKFLIPFSVLVMAGSLFERRVEAPVASGFAIVIEQASQTLAITIPVVITPAAGPSFASLIPSILGAVWAIGFAILLLSRWSKWREIRAVLRTATPIDLPIGVKVMSSPQFFEPGVFGVLNPVLLLPDRIASHLTQAQLEAVLRHELCHIRRRDNLAAAIHMVVEVVFWFHPLVWWLGARLMQERENACDEEVLRMAANRKHMPKASSESVSCTSRLRCHAWRE
jgi:beta-lactamase regulating signal transducer with metallopeptidase domain